jgi:hypothetical protein
VLGHTRAIVECGLKQSRCQESRYYAGEALCFQPEGNTLLSSRLHRVRDEADYGKPDPNHISTSYAERQNLTMLMGIRRFTRLTNGFSKKVENHAYQVALHFMNYNFCRIHKTLRVTLAMEAGLTNHVWSLEE